jgi:hypothetical protein
MKNLSRITIFLIPVMCVTLSSCATYKRCSEKFQWKSDTIKTIVYRDTTISVLIHGTDTVFAQTYIQDTLYFSSGSAHAKVFVVHDTIRAFIVSTDTIVRVKLDSALKVITTQNKQVTTITEKARFSVIMNKVLTALSIILGIVLTIILVPRILKKK